MSDLPSLPPRPADGHKGVFGSVCVIGGHRGDGDVMIGAPALAALAALRSGCGLAMLGMPEPLLAAALAAAPVATGIALPVDGDGQIAPSAALEVLDEKASNCRCLVLGPGLGAQWPQQQLVAALVSRPDRPVILDADGLNALASLEDGPGELVAPIVATPHVGEYRRLAAAVGVDADPTDRAAAAAAMAQRLGCIVVLKSDVTAISDGVEVFEEHGGGVELATGGSGDVLAGTIGGLVAQYLQDGTARLMDAARIAVRVHAMAGRSWAQRGGDRGMLASDLLPLIPEAIAGIGAGDDGAAVD